MTDPTEPNNARPDPDEPEPTDSPGDAEAQVEAILAAIGAEDALRELDERAGTDDGDGRGASQATRLVELARRQFRTVLGSDGKTYAVQLSGPNLALSLRGENGLRTRLARAFFDETQTAPGASALADALNVLEGQAVDTEPEPVALRVAKHDGALSSGRARVDRTRVSAAVRSVRRRDNTRRAGPARTPARRQDGRREDHRPEARRIPQRAQLRRGAGAAASQSNRARPVAHPQDSSGCR